MAECRMVLMEIESDVDIVEACLQVVHFERNVYDLLFSCMVVIGYNGDTVNSDFFTFDL